MGQIKNIKLHIVTDIKKQTQKQQKHKSNDNSKSNNNENNNTMSGGNYIVSKHFKSLGIAIAVFLWLTLGCFGAGLAGNAWVVITTFVQPNNQTASITIGLWKNCTTINNLKNCTTTQLK